MVPMLISVVKTVSLKMLRGTVFVAFKSCLFEIVQTKLYTLTEMGNS